MVAARSDRFGKIGIDRLVKLAWLEKTANLVLAGNPAKAIQEYLYEDLSPFFKTEETTIRGSLSKTLTILLKVWVRPAAELLPLHRTAIELYANMPSKEQILVHWGLTMAAYPFWSAVAVSVGRLLNLQGTSSANQVQRRLREQYGERETVARRARYVLRSFVDWGVLQESSTKGTYRKGIKLVVSQPESIAWLLQAALHARPQKSAPFQELMTSPSFFPFTFQSVSAAQLSPLAPGLDFVRHGLDEYLVVKKAGPA
ncbi:MAG TPA: hypothetical protein PKN04_15240 [bacterium]|nr:hypothetical protein [bacterium]HNT67137.1 hypothetical protein [bacterium]